MAIEISETGPPKSGKSWKFRHLEKGQSGYIYPHYHCAKCDTIIEKGSEHSKRPVSQRKYPGWDYFCSSECGEVLEKQEKSQKRTKYLTWILMFGMVGVIVTLLFIL